MTALRKLMNCVLIVTPTSGIGDGTVPPAALCTHPVTSSQFHFSLIHSKHLDLYQALLYVETVHPEGRNDFGVYLNLAGDASASFPCRVEYSVRLVHHDGKPSSSYFIKGPSGGAVFANRGASWGWRSFVVVKDRITVADSPYVKTVQLPAEAIPDPIPVAAAGSGFIDLTGDDLPPPAPVPVAVATFVATFRFLPLA